MNVASSEGRAKVRYHLLPRLTFPAEPCYPSVWWQGSFWSHETERLEFRKPQALQGNFSSPMCYLTGIFHFLIISHCHSVSLLAASLLWQLLLSTEQLQETFSANLTMSLPPYGLSKDCLQNKGLWHGCNTHYALLPSLTASLYISFFSYLCSSQINNFKKLDQPKFLLPCNLQMPFTLPKKSFHFSSHPIAAHL